MKPTNSIKQSTQDSKNFRITQYNYNELIEYFDSHWLPSNAAVDLSHIKALDSAIGNISKEMPSCDKEPVPRDWLNVHMTGTFLSVIFMG